MEKEKTALENVDDVVVVCDVEEKCIDQPHEPVGGADGEDTVSAPPKEKTKPSAIAAFVLSVVGAAFYLTLSNLVALVLSAVASAKLKAFKKQGGEIKGFALAAKIISVVTLILSIVETAASVVIFVSGLLVTLIEIVLAGLGAIIAAIGTASSGLAAGIVTVLSAIVAALGSLLYILYDLGVLEQIVDRILDTFM